jgi:hypothetical protein
LGVAAKGPVTRRAVHHSLILTGPLCVFTHRKALPCREMEERRKHVLIWVAAEFIQSEGVVQILKEAGLFPAPGKADELFESAEQIAGFALTGWLVNEYHPAGIWIAPHESPELSMMIPWHFVRAVIAAERGSETIYGLAASFAARNRQGISKP